VGCLQAHEDFDKQPNGVVEPEEAKEEEVGESSMPSRVNKLNDSLHL
jgi:hypothetical protein